MGENGEMTQEIEYDIIVEIPEEDGPVLRHGYPVPITETNSSKKTINQIYSKYLEILADVQESYK